MYTSYSKLNGGLETILINDEHLNLQFCHEIPGLFRSRQRKRQCCRPNHNYRSITASL